MSNLRRKASASGSRGGKGWIYFRRFTQLLALFAIIVAPFLGGWQRLDRNYLSAWDGHGWDLPSAFLDLLPTGEPARQAYEYSFLIGGGSGVEYLGFPVADPSGGLLSLATLPSLTLWTTLAWVLPMLLGFLAGRVFCGWFCPFGTLARGLEFLVERLPFQPPRYTLPRSRPLRFVLLAAGIVFGAIGFQLVLYLFLPYVLVQQSIYSLWLMGGGGASLGALAGLLLAGLVFGPTSYCATLCPTGAALALTGRARVFRLKLIQAEDCGAHCNLCDRACWLSLEPSGGDAGPDCDLCARCLEVCPKNNLKVGVGRGARRTVAPLAFLLALLSSSVAFAGGEAWQPTKPSVLLEAHETRDDVDFKVALVDMSKVRLAADDPTLERGIEVSVYMARGKRGAVDQRGKMEPREEIYAGPLTVSLLGDDGAVKSTINFERPNQPISTPNRSIYRRRLEVDLEGGDFLEVAAVPGWSEVAQRWELPEANTGEDPVRAWGYTFATFLLFAGALSLALAWPNREDGRPATQLES